MLYGLFWWWCDGVMVLLWCVWCWRWWREWSVMCVSWLMFWVWLLLMMWMCCDWCMCCLVCLWRCEREWNMSIVRWMFWCIGLCCFESIGWCCMNWWWNRWRLMCGWIWNWKRWSWRWWRGWRMRARCRRAWISCRRFCLGLMCKMWWCCWGWMICIWSVLRWRMWRCCGESIWVVGLGDWWGRMERRSLRLKTRRGRVSLLLISIFGF